MEKMIRPLLFNFLSILMLRPIVDRLIVLTHQPSHLRAIYRQQSKQKSLNQYYMILEQMPELLIQFYVFQIYFNNLETPEDYINFGCKETHRFTYEVTYFMCVENLAKLKICASWWEIYSMLVPFVKIPNSMVSLEGMFRKLSPETPKMSAAASWSLYLAYILMIPSRLFLFAAVMHSAPDHFYIAAYMGIVTLLWLVFNTYNMIQARNKKKNSKKEEQSSNILDHGKTFWSLLLFTIRDVTLISLRRTDAYLLPPSEVNYRSLKTWKDVLAISSYFFIEGVVGAVYVERYYPCGRNTEIFKYQGWLYLVLLIISVTMMALLAYILQPTKINIIPRLFPHRAALICSIGLLMWFVAAGTFNFTTKNRRADVLLPLVITTIILMSILLIIVVVLRFFSEAKQKNSSKDKKSKASKIFSCLRCCSKQNP